MKTISCILLAIVLLSIPCMALASEDMKSAKAHDETTFWSVAQYFVYAIGAILAIILFFRSLVITEQQTAKVVQRLGRFHSVRKPGLTLRIPILDSVIAERSLRLQELKVKVETKTKDNVIVIIVVSVQFQTKDDEISIRSATYKLTDRDGQMTSYVYDIVRAEIPGMTLDNAYENKGHLGEAIQNTLSKAMEEFGIEVKRALVTDIDPDSTVKEAMNKINAASRLQAAAVMEGDAAKIKIVKAAEAEAESKKLQGQGIANERMAIAEGIRNSMKTLQDAGVDSAEVMPMLLLTQYFDTLKDIGSKSGSRVIFVPSDPHGMTDLFKQVSMANLATASTPPAAAPTAPATATPKGDQKDQKDKGNK